MLNFYSLGAISLLDFLRGSNERVNQYKAMLSNMVALAAYGYLNLN